MRSVCKIRGCREPVKGRGWCRSHYYRWWNSGDPHGSDNGVRRIALTPLAHRALAASVPPPPPAQPVALDQERRRKRFLDFGFDNNQATALAAAGYGFTTLERA